MKWSLLIDNVKFNVFYIILIVIFNATLIELRRRSFNYVACCLLKDMELINILYMQDIDIGVGREAYDAGFRLGDNNSDDQTKISHEQVCILNSHH